MLFQYEIYGADSNNCESGLRILNEEEKKAIRLGKGGNALGKDTTDIYFPETSSK